MTDLLLHDSDIIVIDFRQYYLIPKELIEDTYIKLIFNQSEIYDHIQFTWLNKTESEPIKLKMVCNKISDKITSIIDVHVISRSTEQQIKELEEEIKVTYLPLVKNPDGGELSKEEDFNGYKNNFLFRIFKEEGPTFKFLPIDGTHI